MSYDVIIVGGGIIAAASAFELSKAGLKVLVLEKKHVGSGASGASAALLEFQVDAFRGEPFISLAKASRPLFASLQNEIDIQYEGCGIVQVALTEADVAALKAEISRQQALGLKCQWLDQAALQKNLPQVSRSLMGGAFFAEDGQVSGEKFLKNLMKAAVLKGTRLIEGVADIQLVQENNVVSVQTNQQRFEAPHVVLAAGAWSDQLLSPLGFKLGVEPVKGQLAVFDTPHRPLPFPLYTRERGYIASKQDGYTLVGSTMENVGFDAAASNATGRTLAARAIELVPILSSSPFRTTIAGLRPGSPDDLPFLGRFPELPNLIVATGHFRNGILLAPITAKVVSSLVMNQKMGLDLAPFRPDRFSLAVHS